MHLKFRILSFWQVGSGAGSMGTFDSRAARDPDGLPVIPGRQVKGLCRQAVHEAEAMQLPGVPDGTANRLFGTRLPLQSRGRDRGRSSSADEDPLPGVLRFSDAQLPEVTRSALIGQPGRIAALYSSVRSTSMTEKGIARPHSLRFDEVVIPLDMMAEVAPLGPGAGDWQTAIRAALPMLNAIGSGRTRGLGRVIVTLEG
ncbi:MAG: hypothetical protein H9533_21765 [Rhodobacteraceae bacterium]|jgi:hypothetical protein|nr:hypothetical protein [Paracoccaceae bacterium]